MFMFVGVCDKFLSHEDETKEFARFLGQVLNAGDVLLLKGDIGAGKSFFARSLIQSLQDTPEDVPSPTFTLVQTYQTRIGEVWHSDLYRLQSIYEVEELGLWEAFESAICLVEWPELIMHEAPETALLLDFQPHEMQTGRSVGISACTQSWAARLKGLVC